jgi:hypothetical protein
MALAGIICLLFYEAEKVKVVACNEPCIAANWLSIRVPFCLTPVREAERLVNWLGLKPVFVGNGSLNGYDFLGVID